MKKIIVSAPGKIHLLGEHVVVYGKPLILAAVDKRCSVTISPLKNQTIKVVSKSLKVSVTFTEKNLLEKTLTAQKKWEQFYKMNDSQLLKSITAEPLDYVAICLGEAFLYYKKPLPSGFEIVIDSLVPSGMGSSSSVAVAIAAGITLFLEQKFDLAIINEIAFRCEQKQHRFPSGGDNSACCYGGLVWFRKETPDFKIIQQVPISLSDKMANNFFLIDTGKPKESTGEMVSLVKSLTQKRPRYTEKIFNEQESLVKDFLSALKNNDEKEIIKIIKNGEKNLEGLGVVSSYVKSLIRKIEKTGGAAKICGAGGKIDKSGMLLVYTKNSNVIKNLLQSYELSCSPLILGTEGVRQEK